MLILAAMGSEMTTNATPERNSDAAVGMPEAAFEALFREYFVPLCAFSQYHFGLDGDSAKDIVQACFLKLWEMRHAIDTGSSTKSYLYKMVANRCLDQRKHEKIKQRSEQVLLRDLPGRSVMPPVHPDFRELSASIDKAIGELPEQMRRVFELSRYEGLKYAEIAVKLDISVKTVETQMSRAMARLRVKLENYLVLLAVALLVWCQYYKK